jgi:hypothetical protein
VNVEEGQDGQDPAMNVIGGRQLEFREDAPDVLLDRSFADPQLMRYPAVGTAFGDQRQDLPLTVGEHAQRVDPVLLAEQFLHQDRVYHGAASRYPLERVDQVLHLRDPRLQEIADAVSAAEEVNGGFDLDVR